MDDSKKPEQRKKVIWHGTNYYVVMTFSPGRGSYNCKYCYVFVLISSVLISGGKTHALIAYVELYVS